MNKRRQVTASEKASASSEQAQTASEPTISQTDAAKKVPKLFNQSRPSSQPTRVYADGIFDLFHFGHARALEQAKKLFPNTTLVVGCCGDAVTHKYKGMTVMTEQERYESLRHCKWVDEVIPNAPWIITLEFLEKHKIDYVAHDDLPYADTSGSGNGDVYDIVKKAGKFAATQRTEGISTSDLILRILKDYNEYVLRNLHRGYTRKQLGISLVKEQRIRAGDNLRKLSKRLREQQRRMADNLKRMGRRPAAGTPAARTGARLTGAITRRRGLTFGDVLEIKGRELSNRIWRNTVHVEQVVGKVQHQLDSSVSGFIRALESGYAGFERTLASWTGLQQSCLHEATSASDGSGSGSDADVDMDTDLAGDLDGSAGDTSGEGSPADAETA